LGNKVKQRVFTLFWQTRTGEKKMGKTEGGKNNGSEKSAMSTVRGTNDEPKKEESGKRGRPKLFGGWFLRLLQRNLLVQRVDRGTGI